eukprot:PhF_6_TR12942/c0_g1_i1/m.20424
MSTRSSTADARPVDVMRIALRIHVPIRTLLKKIIDGGDATTLTDALQQASQGSPRSQSTDPNISPVLLEPLVDQFAALNVRRSPRHSAPLHPWNFFVSESARIAVGPWLPFTFAWEHTPALLACFQDANTLRKFLVEWVSPVKARPRTASVGMFSNPVNRGNASTPAVGLLYIVPNPEDSDHCILAVSKAASALQRTSESMFHLPSSLKSVVTYEAIDPDPLDATESAFNNLRLDVEYRFPTPAYMALIGYILSFSFICYSVLEMFHVETHEREDLVAVNAQVCGWGFIVGVAVTTIHTIVNRNVERITVKIQRGRILVMALSPSFLFPAVFFLGFSLSMSKDNVLTATTCTGLGPLLFILYRYATQQDLFQTEKLTAFSYTPILMIFMGVQWNVEGSVGWTQFAYSLFGCAFASFTAINQYRRVLPHLPCSLHAYATSTLFGSCALLSAAALWLGKSMKFYVEGPGVGALLYVALYFLFVALRYLPVSVVLFATTLIIPLSQVIIVSVVPSAPSRFLFVPNWVCLFFNVLIAFLLAVYLTFRTTDDRSRVEINLIDFMRRPKRLRPQQRLTFNAIEENTRFLGGTPPRSPVRHRMDNSPRVGANGVVVF